MDKQAFDWSPEVRSEFEQLEEFDGELIDGILTIGRPVDRDTGEEIGVESPQMILKYKVLDVESTDQMGFYSMGSRKSYVFSDDHQMAGGTKKTWTGGFSVKDGPPLNKKCRASRLIEAMAACGFAFKGTDIRPMFGTKWHLKRSEPPDMKGLKEGMILLPTALLSKTVTGAAPVASVIPTVTGAMDEGFLIDLANGKTDSEFLRASYPHVKDNPLLQGKIMNGTWIREKIAEKRLKMDEKGVISKV